MDFIKILLILIISGILIIILRQYKPEYSFFIALAAGGIVLLFVADKIINSIELLQARISNLGIDADYFSVAIKSLGIAYLSSFIADLCRDFGQSSLAEKAELVGKCAIFILCVPLSLSLLNTVLGFIAL